MTIEGPISVIEKTWKPEPLQAKVLSVPDTVFERLGGGAAGGGKTDLTIMHPILRQFHEHPKFKGLVLRRTFPDLEREIIPRSVEWYPSIGGKYNEVKKRWKFPSGAMIQFGHAERESDVRNYDTAEYNTITWEEATGFTEFQYLYLSLSRCRSSSPDLPAFVSSYTNPGNIGHVFFKNRFVDPFPPGGKLIKDKRTNQLRIFIQFFGRDNKWLLINDPGYLARLEGLPEQERRAKLLGDWSAYEGQVFTEFRIAHVEGEPENACHVVGYVPIPEWWPRIIAIDWGWDAYTAVGWFAVSPIGRVYFYRTYAVKKTNYKTWLSEIINLSGKEQIVDVVICHSAGQHRHEDVNLHQQVQAGFDEAAEAQGKDWSDRITVRLAERDRIGGKNLIHEYLRWMPIQKVKTIDMTYDPQFAQWVLRNKGEVAYKNYLLTLSEQPDEINIPKLQIMDRSPEGRENKELIDTIPACVPDERNPEDVKEFKGDDFYDMLRMGLNASKRFIEESMTKYEKINRLEELARIATSEDQTYYYQQLEANKTFNELDQYKVRGHRRVGNRKYHFNSRMG